MLKQLNAKSTNLRLSNSNCELSGMVMDLCAWGRCLAQCVEFIETMHIYWLFFFYFNMRENIFSFAFFTHFYS